jgi:RNA polymerase sigma-70 factor (ECF subfamily)
VRLKFQHGLSYKEIGAVLNLTATNVGFILHTALKAVRARLDDSSEARLRA